jgi:hypothetical protein
MVKSFTDMSSISIGKNKIAQRVNGKAIFLNERVDLSFLQDERVLINGLGIREFS